VEVLPKFNSGATNTLWLCFFYYIFCASMSLARYPARSGDLLQMFNGGATNISAALLLLLHFLCFNISGEVSGESPMRAPTRSGEVLQMFNGCAANILWL
jgi:phosphatidylserine synthase